jgi:hypothetical protein
MVGAHNMLENREQFLEELKLRKLIKNGISVILEKRENEKKNSLLEEHKLRSIIKDILFETAIDDNQPSPHKSTGINVLEDLLKKIIPVLEIDFKKMTTSDIQRTSFRSHIIKGVEKTLAPPRVTAKAGDDSSKLISVREVEVNIGSQDKTPDEEAFIDIDGDGKPDKEVDPRTEFGISGLDETGRNMAFDSFKKISSNIVDSYDLLGTTEDKELFYDYLITNLKLYFDKFETDLAPTVVEPTTPEYESELASNEPVPSDREDIDGVV